MNNMRKQQMMRALLGVVVAVAAIALISYAGRAVERSHSRTPNVPAKKAAPELSDQAAIDHLKQTGCYYSLASAVTAARYRIEPRKGGGWSANNPQHRYSAIFTREAAVVSGKGQGAEARHWQLQMSLNGYGYGERRQSAPTTEVSASDNRIEYQRKGRAGRLTEWYVNRPEGLEQGFTIDQAPGSRKPGEALTLWVGIGEGWKAQLESKGQAVKLTKGTGAELRYEKLIATDARGRELAARMGLGDGAEIKLEVDDSNAVYPVLIDPVLTQQAKLTAGDANFHASFGASVGISGSRVIIGAPGDNLDNGAAYVFLRSGTSWSQEAKLVAAFPSADDGFATSVSISGTRATIGAPGDDQTASKSGAVYVFLRSGTSWSQEAKLKAADAAADDFLCQSVDINDTDANPAGSRRLWKE